MAVDVIPGCIAYSIFKSCVKCFSIFYGQTTVYLQTRPISPESVRPHQQLHLLCCISCCANKNQLHSNSRFWFICNTYASLALKSNINTKYRNIKCQNTAVGARSTYLIDCNCNGKERNAKCEKLRDERKEHIMQITFALVFLAELPGAVQAVNKTEFTTAMRLAAANC